MHIACLDLEGVLVPEIWINVAGKTGVEELKLTTRDIADYDELMSKRLEILDRHNLSLADILAVIEELEPLPGALEFLDWLRNQTQVLILSDTFQEFAAPLMRKLHRPTLFCHSLEIDTSGRVADYHLRLPDHKKHTVRALQGLNFRVIAAGDSYNDTTMLAEADAGIFFRPPQSITAEFPQFPVTYEYAELSGHMEELLNNQVD